MSELSEAVIDAVEDEDAAQAVPPTSDPDGREWVDFNDLPPAVAARFKRMYGHMKEYERDLGSYKQKADLLIQHNQELGKYLAEFVEEQETKQEQDNALKQAEVIKQRFADGDYEGGSDLLFKTLAKPKPETQRVVQPQAAPTLGANEAVAINQWAYEKDDTGTPRRPWTHNGHPLQKRAIKLLDGLIDDPVLAPQGLNAVLAEVDRIMNVEQKPARSAVLSSDSVRPAKASNNALTDEQRQIAFKMGLKPEDYAKQLKAIGSKK